MWFSKKSCRCYSLFRQPLVDLWSLILWYVLASQSKTCQETYEDHIRQNFTGEYTGTNLDMISTVAIVYTTREILALNSGVQTHAFCSTRSLKGAWSSIL